MALKIATLLSNADYTILRDQLLKINENAALASGSSGAGKILIVDGHPTIGYGWDLVVNGAAATEQAFSGAGIMLSAAEKLALEQYKVNGNLANFQAAWSGVNLTDAQATSLLDVAASAFESALDAAVGAGGLPLSRERAAIVSQLYNTGPKAPTEIGIIKSNPSDKDQILKQHEDVWYEIAYDSDKKGQNYSHGLEIRRLREADTFGLYSSNEKPADDDEAETVYRYLDIKNTNGVLIAYLTDRGYSSTDARATIAAQYDPAFKYLVSKFSEGISIAEYGDIFVGNKNSKNTIMGGTVNNIIIGGDLDDIIKASQGSDVVYGGSGVDTIDYSAETGPITISYNGGGASSTIAVSDGKGGTAALHSIELIKGTSKADVLKISGSIAAGQDLTVDADHGQNGAGQDVLDGAGATLGAGLSVHIAADGTGTVTDKGTGGVIKLLNFDTDLFGTSGNDTISDITAGAKHFSGGSGDDVISTAGSTGNSTILGGAGNDTLTGGSGNDVLDGGDGVDRLYGGSGSDLLISGNSDPTFNDYDILDGGDGDDELISDATSGEVDMTGGAGNDVYQIYRDSSFGTENIIIAGDGHDELIGPMATQQFYDFSPVYVGDYGGTGIELSTWDSTDTKIVWDAEPIGHGIGNDGQQIVELEGDLAVVNNATGSSVLIKDVVGVREVDDGSYENGKIYSMHLPGLSLADENVQFVDGGYNISSFEMGDVSQYEGAQTDFATGVGSSSPQSGSDGDDYLNGSAGDDVIYGGAGDDTIAASEGSDSIDGGAGNDTLAVFGSSADYQFSQGADGSVVVTSLVDPAYRTSLTNVEAVSFAADGQTYNVDDLLPITGTGDGDTLVGNVAPNTISALGGDDVIVGGGGDDAVDGGDGYDIGQYAGASSNYAVGFSLDGSLVVKDLVGLDGTDTLNNVEELDFLGDGVSLAPSDFTPAIDQNGDMTFTARNDLIFPSSEVYGIDGGAGHDEIMLSGDASNYNFSRYSDGSVSIFGITSPNIYTLVNVETIGFTSSITLLNVNDLIPEGTSNSDVINGTSLNERLYGDAGDDVINGNAGDDYLEGDEGDDLLTGGRGNDTLEGSDGTDTAVYSGDFADYTVSEAGGGGVEIADSVSTGYDGDGVDDLYDVEFARFADVVVSLSTLDVVDHAPVALQQTVSTTEDEAILSGTLSASDPDIGDVLSFALDAPVSGLTLDNEGHWTFAPSDGAYQHLAGGEQLVVNAAFTVSDQSGLSAASTLAIILTGTNDAPTVDQPIADQLGNGGEVFAFAVPQGTFSDIDGDALTLSATLDDGAPLPDWLSFANGQFTGTLPDAGGQYSIRVNASDGSLQTSTVFELDISPSSDPGSGGPEVANGMADTAVYWGQVVDLTIPTDAFSDPGGTLTYSAALADGTPLPSWLSLDGDHLLGTVPDTALGILDVRITATDGGQSASSVFRLTTTVQTGNPITSDQWQLVTDGNDRILDNGPNTGMSGFGGDDVITLDAWNVSADGGDGNDVFEMFGNDDHATGGNGADTFLFDGGALVRSAPNPDAWATINDFVPGEDRIGILNGTGGVASYAGLQQYMSQSGSDVLIQFQGLPTITLSNVSLTDLSAADFLFTEWASTGTSATPPPVGVVPYPTTTNTVDLYNGTGDFTDGNDRVLGSGAGNVGFHAEAGDDYITTDGWNVTAFGDQGNDVFEINGTVNTIIGGPGYDYYIFDSTQITSTEDDTWATIADYADGIDKVVFRNGTGGMTGFNDLGQYMAQDGNDVTISLPDLPTIRLTNVNLSQLDASDFLFEDDGSSPQASAAIMTSGTGSGRSRPELANYLTGGPAHIRLSGIGQTSSSAADLTGIRRAAAMFTEASARFGVESSASEWHDSLSDAAWPHRQYAITHPAAALV